MAFSFASVGHFFASVAHDLASVGQWVTGHQAQIDSVAETGVSILSLVDPALAPVATTIERAGEAALGQVLATLAAAGTAAGADGLNVSFDAALVAEFKALLASIEALKPGTQANAAALKTALATPAKTA